MQVSLQGHATLVEGAFKGQGPSFEAVSFMAQSLTIGRFLLELLLKN